MEVPDWKPNIYWTNSIGPISKKIILFVTAFRLALADIDATVNW